MRLRKTRPQRSEQECPSCSGVGRFLERDWLDDGGPVTIDVACEGCLGCGKLVDCATCDEPAPATVIELNSGHCGPCAADHASRDGEAERARLRRWA